MLLICGEEVPLRPDGQLKAIVETQLREDMVDVTLRGPHRDAETPTDLPVRSMVTHQGHDLQLTGRETAGASP
jgi:hypothetical protein